MDQAEATAILDRLHTAQNEFYGGGDERALRAHRRDVLVGNGTRIAALTDGTASISGAQHAWSTVGLYEISDQARITACWLLPLDPAAFDVIWSG